MVIGIADLYLPLGGAAVAGAAAPGIESAGRFGERAALQHGWREWLAHALGRADLAGAAPACIAAAEVAPAGPAVGASGTLWIATPLHLSAGAAGRRSRHCGRGVPGGGRCSPSAARRVPCAPSARTRM